MTNCQNPECRACFDSDNLEKKYCDEVCRNRAQKIRERDRRRAKAAERQKNMTHPCKRCGGPAEYRKVYCVSCRTTPKGAGIAPLRTKAILNSRKAENEAVEQIVAKAKENNTIGPDMFRWRKISKKGVKLG